MLHEKLLAIVMAGGDGRRLRPLTQDRAKPAVPFGGIYRIIDFTLSNCVNSNIRQILVLTQYKSDSLNRHVNLGWSLFSSELGEFVWTLPPQKRVGDDWYLGTADSVYQNVWSMRYHDPDYVIILSADHVYKMDYRKMLAHHLNKGADVTIGAVPVPVAQGSEFGVLQVDDDMKLIEFEEKPEKPSHIPGDPETCLASMGIYIFPAQALFDVLEDGPGQGRDHDFGRDILPKMLADGRRLVAYPFTDENKSSARKSAYWRDVGTIGAYFDANMDLISVDPEFNLYDPTWPIRTLRRQLPPAKFVFADEGTSGRRGVALDSMVAGGCIISGGQLRRCLMSPKVRINSYAEIEDSILMDDVDIGRHCRIRRTIIDKYVQVPPGIEIGFDPELDRKRGFTVTEDGITVVARRAEIPL